MKVLAYLSALLLFAPIASAETVLLEFTAKWCPPCREMESVVAGLEREGYRVDRLNVDLPENKAKMRQFNVQNIPTFIVIKDGREANRLVGARPAEDLRRLLGPANKGRTPTPKPQEVGSAKPKEVPLANLATSGRIVDRDLISRSVRIIVDDGRTRTFATGTVIRSVPGETLVLSCSHLFERVSRRARTAIEFYGASDSPALSSELVARDPDADVSLLRVSTERVFPTALIASPQFTLAPGKSAISVGCDNGQPASVRRMRITAVNRYHGAPTIECSGEPVEGRSGGGLFNEFGELIGVCLARDPAEKRGIYGGLAAVHRLLDRQGLAALYQAKPAEATALASKGQNGKKSEPRVPLPSPKELGLNVRDDLISPAGVENAEVVMVIRSRIDPQSPARIVMINQATPELLALVEKEHAAQDARTNTSMRMPISPDVRPISKSAPGPIPATDSNDLSNWRPAPSVREREMKEPDKNRSTILESARWEKNWEPGASAADAPVRR